jgi:hypothetical protein
VWCPPAGCRRRPDGHFRLDRGHPDDPITSCHFTACGDRALTPDADPQHLQGAKRVLPPLLGRRTAEEDLIDDDPGTGTGHRSDPFHPRSLQHAELRRDDDLTVRSELDPRGRRLAATALLLALTRRGSR